MKRRSVEAMQDFLSGIGVDIEKAGMEKTPARVAEMFEYLFNGMNTDTAEIWGELFPSEADGIVVVKEIPFYSMCEHHLLPFFGRVSLAYLPKNGMVAGFSKFTKLVEVISHRPIADGLEAEGVLVIVEATQLCMCMRGDCAHDTRTMTSVGLGALKEGTALGQQAFSMIVDNRKELAR